MRDFTRAAAILGVVCCALATPIERCHAVTVQLESVGPMSPRNVAAWWSPIVSAGGAEYVSYLAANSPQDDVFVARRGSGASWETRDTGVNATYDPGHTQTSMAIDGDGYLHVAYGMHNNPMRLVTSNFSENVTGGFSAPSSAAISAFAGGSYTYPNMTTAPNGDVYMIVRDQRSSYASQQGRLFRFDNSVRTWSELPPFAGQSGTTVYPDQVLADASGDLHILWEWAAGGAQAARHYGSYARFDPDTNTYFRADGTAYPAGPIRIATADIYQGLEGAETFAPNVHGVQSAKLALDDQGRPLIAYGYSTNGTDSAYQHRFARWTGSEWTRSVVTAGPFDIQKPWIAYSTGVLRYYGALSDSDPQHTGTDDLFVRTSADLGQTWSSPIAVTSGLDIQRPVGFNVGQTDHLYLPSTTGGDLYVARVTWDAPLQPPSFPYYNGFKTESLSFATDAFSLDAANEKLHYSAGGGLAVDSATQAIDDIGTSSFTLSTRFVIDEVAGTGNLLTIGFGAFGSSSDFQSTNGESFYVADWGVDTHGSQGQLRILALGDSSGFVSSTGDSDGSNPNGSSVETGKTYELRLVGEYFGDNLGLTLSLYDAEGNQIGTSATATDSSPLDGQYFGYRNRVAGADHMIDVSYEQFSLTAPLQLLGDYNNDGAVDGADYVFWQKTLGQLVPNNSASDGNGNGLVNAADYNAWGSHFGNASNIASHSMTSTATLPEPSSWILVSFALLFFGELHSKCRASE